MILELGAGGVVMVTPPEPGSRLAKALEGSDMFTDGGSAGVTVTPREDSVADMDSSCSRFVPDNPPGPDHPRTMPDRVNDIISREAGNALDRVIGHIELLSDVQLKAVLDKVNREIVRRWTR